MMASLGILGRLSVVSYTRRPSRNKYGCCANHCPFPPSQRDLSVISYASTQASSTSTMSQVPSTATSPTDFETILRAALEAYKEQTKEDIASHPLAVQLQSCDSPGVILAVLRAQVQTFDQSQSTYEKLTKWLDPTVNVLYAFSTTLGNGAGLVN